MLLRIIYSGKVYILLNVSFCNLAPPGNKTKQIEKTPLDSKTPKS